MSTFRKIIAKAPDDLSIQLLESMSFAKGRLVNVRISELRNALPEHDVVALMQSCGCTTEGYACSSTTAGECVKLTGYACDAAACKGSKGSVLVKLGELLASAPASVRLEYLHSLDFAKGQLISAETSLLHGHLDPATHKHLPRIGKGDKMTHQADFAADHLSAEEGLNRLLKVTSAAGFAQRGRIITSRDEDVRELRHELIIGAVPEGFQKWQLPVYLPEASQLYLTVAEPNAEVPEHSHPEGDGIRFVVSGSIHYGAHELVPGDWMFIPAGVAYKLRVGDLGAVLCYCYCCSCAGARDLLSRGDPVEGQR
jgi:hypothetical protein